MAIAIVIGIIFIVLFYVAGEKIFTGNSQSIFKGVVSWLASLLITVVAFHMLKFYNVERKWRRKLEGAMHEDRAVGGGWVAAGRGAGAAYAGSARPHAARTSHAPDPRLPGPPLSCRLPPSRTSGPSCYWR